MKAHATVAGTFGERPTDEQCQMLILSVLARSAMPLTKLQIEAVIALENSVAFDLGLAENVLEGRLEIEAVDGNDNVLDVDRYIFKVKEVTP